MRPGQKKAPLLVIIMIYRLLDMLFFPQFKMLAAIVQVCLLCVCNIDLFFPNRQYSSCGGGDGGDI
ncbi:MAG: hypothetical protein A2Z14_10935 [Chloroflexi bacterium RBG_16_48_8]|nr:MAG: hypothetical protein A2Z14_10935 [Chloroflexi bacterium RBG_16_48_8]